MTKQLRYNKRKYQVLLSCNHSTLYPFPPPTTGDEVYCRRCAAYALVTVTEDTWRIQCEACTYSRNEGVLKHRATHAADRHSARYPGHVVAVFKGPRLLYKTAKRSQQISLEDLMDEPPF